MYSPRPSPPPPPLTSPPILQKEIDDERGDERLPPLSGRGGRRPSHVINPTVDGRRRDEDEEDEAPVLGKKLNGKGGGKGEWA